jgi:hypothetical protein
MVPIAIAIVSMCLAPADIALPLADDGVAIVAELRGSATIREPGNPERQVQTYDWVAENATITVANRSLVVLVMATGSRYELAENAQVVVVRGGLPISRTVRALPAFPSVPSVAPIEASSGAATRKGAAARVSSGAERIRGSSISNIYPSEVATIAEKTTLRFRTSSGATSFLVVIQDDQRRPVFDIKVGRGEVVVPPGVLEAGRRYNWRVTVVDDFLTGEAEAAFTTLPAPTVQAREAFVAVLHPGDAHQLALLALVDERLGLLLEARDELVEADRRAPGDPEIRRILARIGKQLGEPIPD